MCVDAKKLFMNIVGLELGVTEQVLVCSAFVHIYGENSLFFIYNNSVIVIAYHIYCILLLNHLSMFFTILCNDYILYRCFISSTGGLLSSVKFLWITAKWTSWVNVCVRGPWLCWTRLQMVVLCFFFCNVLLLCMMQCCARLNIIVPGKITGKVFCFFV